MKTRAYAQTGKSTAFHTRYTQDDQGFYVRNEKPSAGTLNEKRIEENVRSLVNEVANRRNEEAGASEE